MQETQERKEDEKVEKTQKNFFKRKVIGIPVFILMIMGISLILAGVVYLYIYQPTNTSFVKTINVNSSNQTITQYVLIQTNGDINNTTLNCNRDINPSCAVSTGQIMLVNMDPINPHNCTIETNGDLNNVIVTYTGIVNTNPSVVVIGNNSQVVFWINYNITADGSYPMNTTIICP